MKSLLDNLIRAIWHGLAPIRRPFVRKFDDHVNRLVNQVLSAELEQHLAPSLSAALETTTSAVQRLDLLIATSSQSSEGTEIALRQLIDEVVQLRHEVERLRQIVQPSDALPSLDGESLDGLPFDESTNACTPFPTESSEERARVG